MEYFMQRKNLKNSKSIKVYQGPKYLILDNKYSKRKKRVNLKKVIKIFISSGGSDKKKIYIQDYKIFKKYFRFKN